LVITPWKFFWGFGWYFIAVGDWLWVFSGEGFSAYDFDAVGDPGLGFLGGFLMLGLGQ
jgi:hypothetical protein